MSLGNILSEVRVEIDKNIFTDDDYKIVLYKTTNCSLHVLHLQTEIFIVIFIVFSNDNLYIFDWFIFFYSLET